MRRAEYDDLFSSAFNMAGELVWNKNKYGADPELALWFYRLWRMARRHQQQLIKRAGDILLYCEDLILAKEYLPIKYVWELRINSIYGRETRYEDWHTCFALFANNFDFVNKVESPQNIKETKKFLRSKGVNVSRVDDIIETALEYEDYWVLQEEDKVSMPSPFSDIYGKFEYRLCRRICKYLGFKSNVTEGNLKRMYILVFTVCLYTAIKNELERLCNEMDYEGYKDVRERYGVSLDIRAEMQKQSKSVSKQHTEKEENEGVEFVPMTNEEIYALFNDIMTDKTKAFESLTNESGQTEPVEQPAQVSMTMPPEKAEATVYEREQEEADATTDEKQKETLETQEEKTTLEQKKKKSMPAITEKEQVYFDEAANEGFLKKVGPNKYKWLYARTKSSIVFFFIKAYDPASPPYKELGDMFDLQGLSKCAESMKKRQWYLDELKREGKMERFKNEGLGDPPEWANRLIDFFKSITGVPLKIRNARRIY